LKAFTLKDAQGKAHTGGEWKGKKAIVLFFLNTECPVSNHYAPEYTRLAKTFGNRNVAFYGVHPDPDVTPEAARKHAGEYKLTFPILMDPKQVLTSTVGIRVTPEAVVLSPRGKVLYRGRIDNRYALDGKRRDEPTVRDLEAALEAVLAGKAPPRAQTKAFGCPLPAAAK
jgi:peroxiredoxin